ncbi:MAG TPA: endolytic transglycosylase MltG [Terriglobia bacterium]|nr:endolytic transglycosylase MltG [Terriglobia bacterium]
MKKWLLAFALILLAGGAALLYRELVRSYRGYGESVLLEIQPGTSSPQVAGLLVSRGVLAHRIPFLLLHVAGRLRHRSLKAGEYLFDGPLTPIQIYRKLIHGDVYLHPVVIPEGSDRFDMARILHQQIGMDAPAFLDVTSQPQAVHDLDPQAPSLEGFLFPDTYRFARGASPAAVALAMMLRFRHVLEARFPPELRQSPERLHQVLTLASLVEKETPATQERPMIAGVFTRRLAARMPLQCDPTVVYAARLDHQSGPGPITEDELALDSPYNTYRNPGLPPGPICSPGEVSLRAALDPAPGKALYFVSNNHGGHVFASTLAEHQHNVARYRRRVAELRQSTGEESPVAKRTANRSSAEHKVHGRVRQKPRIQPKNRKKERAHSRVSSHAQP